MIKQSELLADLWALRIGCLAGAGRALAGDFVSYEYAVSRAIWPGSSGEAWNTATA